ncbi:hypothetical protein [Mesorhizobium sp. WSM3864]|uniref:hypothetical protein n=1 Tax=Mesorhizobium sp. WSM3864 TaxID=2029404 RepID=UPI001140E442|nr:hypothetical protein [Mesorhizobium sp. WSM3864]
MLTIVINLRFTQIGPNRLPLTEKGGQAPREPASQKRIFRRQQAVWEQGKRKAKLQSAPSASEDGDML